MSRWKAKTRTTMIRGKEVRMRPTKEVSTTGREATKGDDAITWVKKVGTTTAPIGTLGAAVVVALVQRTSFFMELIIWAFCKLCYYPQKQHRLARYLGE